MTSTNSSVSYIASLQYATNQINVYASTFLLLFGFVGNMLNFLVFTSDSLRSKPCVVYFFLASVANLISLISSLLPRVLQSFLMIPDQTEILPTICKMRIVILFSMRTVSTWLIALATIDRYLISSMDVNQRRKSNLNNVFRMFAIVLTASCIIWAESGYCFDINYQGNTPQKCYAKSDACRIYNELAQAIITTLIPSIVMFAFGFLTIHNIKKSRNVHQSTRASVLDNTNGRARKDERSLTIMLITQVLFLTTFSLPIAGQKFYITYTFYQTKSSIQRALESFIFAFVIQLVNVPSCMTFYLYTITGSVFRKTLFKLLKKGMLYFKCC